MNFDKLNERLSSVEPSKLKAKKLYLYYTQLGRCMYSGETIDITQLNTTAYDIDHIYPQSKVKDVQFYKYCISKKRI